MEMNPAQDLEMEAARPSAMIVALALLWRLLCIPVYAVLAVFRPLISVVLAGFGMLGVLVALSFRFLFHLPHFSFWTVLGVSIGSLVSIMVYDVILELFRPR